jgi:hypothetical protein
MPLEVELGEVSVGLRPVGSALEVRARVAARRRRRRGVRCIFADISCCLMNSG